MASNNETLRTCQSRSSNPLSCLSTTTFKRHLECQYGLLDYLLQNECLTAEEVRNLRQTSLTYYERNNRLIEHISASNISKFVQGLWASNQGHLVNYIRQNGDIGLNGLEHEIKFFTTDRDIKPANIPCNRKLDKWPMSGLMSSTHKEIFDVKLRLKFIRELKLDAEFFAVMRIDHCMTETMLEHVEIKLRNSGRPEAVSEFLTRLKTRPERAFKQFVKALIETEQEHLAEEVDDQLITIGEEPLSPGIRTQIELSKWDIKSRSDYVGNRSGRVTYGSASNLSRSVEDASGLSGLEQEIQNEIEGVGPSDIAMLGIIKTLVKNPLRMTTYIFKDDTRRFLDSIVKNS